MGTRMSSYAQLGKAELIQAIGVIDDYNELSEIELEIEEGKAKTILTQEKHSEKDKYGDKERLATAPFLLWMYLHYLSPDEQGLIRNISIVDAAEYLNLSVKGIRMAIKTLSKLGYIYSSDIIKNIVTVMLPDFKNYFKSKEQGGHGYLELSETNFLSIVAIAAERTKRGSKNPNAKYENKSIINKIRIKMRSFIMCDYAQRQFKRNKKADTMVEKTVRQMLQFLPRYIYPKKLLELLCSIRDTIAYAVIDDKIRMNAIVADFNGVKERNSRIHSLSKNVKNKLQDMNYVIEQYNAAEEKEPYELTKHGIYLREDIETCYIYTYSDEDLKDIAKLCLQYSEDIVFDALGYVYSNFIILGRTIKSIGALLRASIKSYAF